MNKIILIQFFMLLIYSFSALALDLSTSSITIGNDRSERSNLREDFVVRDSATFSILNTDTLTDITNLAITTNAAQQTYNCTFSFANGTLTPGGSATVTTSCMIPDSLDGVDSSLQVNPISVGTITVTGIKNATQVQKSVDLKMQAENMLEIKSMFVSINKESDRKFSDGKTVRDLKPGYRLEIQVDVRNNFATSRRENIDIEDVEVTLDSNERDIDILDSSINLGRISAKRTDNGRTDIIIDEFIDSGSSSKFPIQITAEGVDENGARHADHFEIILEVRRESYELEINDVRYPRQTFCGDRQIPLSIRLKNIGRNDDDTFGLNVNSDELNFLQRIENIDLNQNEDLTESLFIPIDSSIPPGEKRIEIVALHRRDEISNKQTISVLIPDCSERQEPVIVEKEDNGEEQDTETEEVVLVTPRQPIVVDPVSFPVLPSEDTTVERALPSYYLPVAGFIIALLMICMIVLFFALLIQSKRLKEKRGS